MAGNPRIDDRTFFGEPQTNNPSKQALDDFIDEFVRDSPAAKEERPLVVKWIVTLPVGSGVKTFRDTLKKQAGLMHCVGEVKDYRDILQKVFHVDATELPSEPFLTLGAAEWHLEFGREDGKGGKLHLEWIMHFDRLALASLVQGEGGNFYVVACGPILRATDKIGRYAHQKARICRVG